MMNAIMQEAQVKRALKAIERDRAEKVAELARLDRAAEALMDLLPGELKATGTNLVNGSASVGAKRATRSFGVSSRESFGTSGSRRRGMKEAIAEMLQASPNRVFTLAEIRRRLDDMHLINPAAENPEKMIGTALRRLRNEDAKFAHVGRGKYTYDREGAVTGS